MRKAGATHVRVGDVAVFWPDGCGEDSSQASDAPALNTPAPTSRPYTDEDETDRWEQQNLPLQPR